MNDGRSCESCCHLVSEQWPKVKTAFRCFADSGRKGRVVAIDRFAPLIDDDCRPAWCPEKMEELENRRDFEI